MGTKFWMALVAVCMLALPGVVIYWGVQDATTDMSQYHYETTHHTSTFMGMTIKSSSTRLVPNDQP